MDSKEKLTAEVAKAAEVVKKGGLILYPTDTVWGVGCDATNEASIAKIFALKQRADSKSMLALVADEGMLARWVENVPDTAYMLIDVAADPLTIIYDRPKGVAANLTADDGSLGIRIAEDAFCKALCRRCGVPVVSTSANISGSPAPTLFSEITQEILDGVDLIVDWRRNDSQPHRPSGIIKVRDDETFSIIR